MVPTPGPTAGTRISRGSSLISYTKLGFLSQFWSPKPCLAAGMDVGSEERGYSRPQLSLGGGAQRPGLTHFSNFRLERRFAGTS
eukprot:6666859-Pyramimonas_sp.AAC.1